MWGDEGFSACHTHGVIPVKTGIQCAASAVLKAIPAKKSARCWIPACAGMTLGVGRELWHVFGHRSHPPPDGGLPGVGEWP